MRWFAQGAERIAGRNFDLPQGGLRAIVSKRAVGPTLAITPWSFPLAMATRKIGPALAAGCPVIVKPASLTPLTTLVLVDILDRVGVPAGVVSALPSASAREISEPLLADSRLRKLSFTGSTAVGQTLLRGAADGILRTSMELGGCAPFIVFADADLEVALEAAVATKLRNMGQACNASSRFYVHHSLYREFVEELVRRFSALPVGDPFASDTEVGPLVSGHHRHSVHNLVIRAVSEGATLRCGGEVPAGPGYFYPPTVIEVEADSALMREEVFGPVAPVCAFDTEEEVIRWANSSEFGLAGYAYTSDMKRALSLAKTLQVGMISVNAGTNSNAAAPFGGVKASGLGREGGEEGIDEYLETVYLAL